MLEATAQVAESLGIRSKVMLHGGIGVGNYSTSTLHIPVRDNSIRIDRTKPRSILLVLKLLIVCPGAEGENKRCNLVPGEAFTLANANMVDSGRRYWFLRSGGRSS